MEGSSLQGVTYPGVRVDTALVSWGPRSKSWNEECWGLGLRLRVRVLGFRIQGLGLGLGLIGYLKLSESWFMQEHCLCKPDATMQPQMCKSISTWRFRGT